MAPMAKRQKNQLEGELLSRLTDQRLPLNGWQLDDVLLGGDGLGWELVSDCD